MQPDTLQEKLSKLMNGREEGEKLLDKLEVAAGLAAELGESVERLKFLRGLPKIVLHPNVPQAVQDYLRKRAEELYDTSECIVTVSVDPGNSDGRSRAVTIMKAVGEAASRLSGAVLVVAGAGTLGDPDERTLYEVAKLDLAFLAQHPRGHQIVGHAEVLPLMDPEPPKLEDADGKSLYQVPEIESQARAARDSIDAHRDHYRAPPAWDRLEGILSGSTALGYEWRSKSPVMQRVSAILTREEVPTFYAEEVLRWCCSRYELAPSLVRERAPKLLELFSEEVAVAWHIKDPPARSHSYFIEEERARLPPPLHELLAEDFDQRRFGTTMIWQHEARWFAMGERVGEIRAYLEEHCPRLELVEPGFPSKIAQLLRARRNPWIGDPEWFAELSRDTAADCGVQVDADLLRLWRNEAMLRAAEKHRHYRFTTEDQTGAQVLRRHLDSLLSRELVLSEASAWIYFVLQAALDAPWLAASANVGGPQSNAIVNLGAGHLIRLRVTEYPVEPASALRVVKHDELASFCGYAPRELHVDGGDLHLQIAELARVPLLEAGPFPAIRRRQEAVAAEEARNAARRDDDD